MNSSPADPVCFFRNSGEEGKLHRKLSRIGSRSQREPPRPPPQVERPPPATPPRQREPVTKPPEAAAKPLEPSPKPQMVCPKPPDASLKPCIPPKPHIQVFNSAEHGNAMLKVNNIFLIHETKENSIYYNNIQYNINKGGFNLYFLFE